MIRTLTAYTENIDDMDAAVAEIKARLDCEHNLLRYSVGIVACHYEFALSGAVAAVGKALPFDTIGAITAFNGVAGESGLLRLSVMVLTSNDVRFKTLTTPSLKKDAAQGIEEAWRTAGSSEEEKPSLMLAYAPFMAENSGDEYVRILGELSGGVPCFGTLAIDDTPDFHNCFMLHNGEYYADRMGLLLIYGNIRPRFFLAGISKDKVLDRSGVITASEGHILKEVDNRPIVEFFEVMGLTKASETAYALTSLPFMLDYGDGTPLVIRMFIGLNGQKQAICAGAMPEGATLYLGVSDKDDILLTTGKSIHAALAESQNASGMLIYSCISRSMTLGNDQFAEMNVAAKENSEGLPCLMAYSGGEFCPTGTSGSSFVNRFHNGTCIICVF
jgi:hypothetical protein